jgi:SAM-dependent methyltransferase
VTDAWRPPPYRTPGPPDTAEYGRAHRRFVADALDDPALIERFRAGAPLQAGFGIGLDERVVEFPWLRAHATGGPALDAGSTLNHAHVLDAVLADLAPLHVTTLRPEPVAFTERGVSYVYADLRDLPYRDGVFRTVLCASTLEHVGMDNAIYGAEQQRTEDPDRELDRALHELRRVLAPQGTLLITVPYGEPEDHGWFRQLDRAGVERVVAQLGALDTEIGVFAHGEDGWQRSDLDAAASARYGRDTPAAQAVACLALRF